MSRPSNCRAAVMASLQCAHMHSVLSHALPAVHFGTRRAPSPSQVHCPLVCLESFLVPPACTAAQNPVGGCTTGGDHGQGRCPSVLRDCTLSQRPGKYLKEGTRLSAAPPTSGSLHTAPWWLRL